MGGRKGAGGINMPERKELLVGRFSCAVRL